MQEIKCPKCGELFQIDESGYAQIVSQVRDREFNLELERRQKDMEEKRASDMQLVRAQQEKDKADALIKKDAQIAQKELEIASLKEKLSSSEKDKQLAVTLALSDKDKQLAEKSAAIIELQGKLQRKETEHELSQKALKEQFEASLKHKDEQIEYYKDFKARQSTKMVGESLESHCLSEFNKLRMTAFPNAYFEKDNDASSGSKGDFIFRECAPDGTEYISIMFEMKNEADQTKTKHKNEDFFKELDKDRKEKNCEYAVLVSLLESDSEYYNTGIVDVSYRYPKMYVVRPQFFIPIITLLRNAALNSLKYRQELQVVKNQQIDILNFEQNMAAFKDAFARNYRLASERFAVAIDEIDKTIQHLQKTKEALLSSENNLRLANNKLEDVSIKKLTKNAPAVKAMFEKLHSQDQDF